MSLSQYIDPAVFDNEEQLRGLFKIFDSITQTYRDPCYDRWTETYPDLQIWVGEHYEDWHSEDPSTGKLVITDPEIMKANVEKVVRGMSREELATALDDLLDCLNQ